MTAVALALAWPWAVLKVLGLVLEFSDLGLGLMTCGLINISDSFYSLSQGKCKCWQQPFYTPVLGSHFC